MLGFQCRVRFTKDKSVQKSKAGTPQVTGLCSDFHDFDRSEEQTLTF